jgi:hypothetical protein
VGVQGDVPPSAGLGAGFADHVANTVAARSGRRSRGASAAGLHRLAAALGALGRDAKLVLADPDGSPDAGAAESRVSTTILSTQALGNLRRAWEAEIQGRSWIGRWIAHWSLRQGSVLDKTGWKHKIADSMTLRAFRRKLGAETVPIWVVTGKGERPDSKPYVFGIIRLIDQQFRGKHDGASGR